MTIRTSKTETNRFFAWAAIAFFAMSMSGCQPPPSAETQTEELHEHFPAHWPYTIFRASARLAELAANPSAASNEHSVTPRDEFVDLVNWLPILAADSDLDRPTFDRIDSWSTRSVSQWQRATSPRELSIIVQEPETQEMIAWLSDICRQEELRLKELN